MSQQVLHSWPHCSAPLPLIEEGPGCDLKAQCHSAQQIVLGRAQGLVLSLFLGVHLISNLSIYPLFKGGAHWRCFS